MLLRFRAFATCGEATSSSPTCLASRELSDPPSRLGFPLEWAVLLLPLAAAVKERTGKACCVRRTASSPEGVLLLPLPTCLRQPLAFGRALKLASAFVAGVAASTPSLTAPSREENREANHLLRATRRRAAGCTSVAQPLSSARPIGHRSQRPASTRERWSDSAICRARSSRRPARRARSCATIASSCRRAVARSSFTST